MPKLFPKLPLRAPTLFFLVLALGLATFLQGFAASAAPADKPIVGEGFIPAETNATTSAATLATEPPGETDAALRGYVSHLLDKNFVKLQDMYQTPLEGMSEYSYDILRPQEANPVMATRVKTAVGDRTGLAVAVEGGKIFVFSSRPCKRLALPKADVTCLGYDRSSPLLAAYDNKGGRVAAIDLETCRAWVVAEGLKQDQVERLFISPDGQWLVALTANHTLLAGRARGGLAPALRLHEDPILLAFTPGNGMLAVLEPSGKMIFWALPAHKQVREITVPGGPFVQASLDGYNLNAVGADGKSTCLEVVRQTPIACARPAEEPARILERKGNRLYVRTGLTRWNMSELMGHLPDVYLSFSPSRQAVKVLDMDGRVRYYDAETGRKIGPVAATDWDMVPRDEGWVYHVGKRTYKLAEVVAQRGPYLRYARYVPDTGFYLWWEPANDLDNWVRHYGSLPIRTSIREDAPSHWLELRGGNLP